MKKKLNHGYLQLLFVLIVIISFFIFNLDNISYGLPYFVNTDESAFIGSTLSSFSFLTKHFEYNYNPLYAPLLNFIIILKSLFINELIINGLSIDEIELKIYFNPELFTFYGRLANSIIACLSIFILFLIFKKLKINFFIYGILLVTFISSSVIFNIATVFGKNASYLLIYLIQLYFFLKYLLKINKFNFYSYIIMGLLASLAWGVNYWPSFISIYAILILHFTKFKFNKINYILIFSLTFIIFGPIINLFFVGEAPIWLLTANLEGNFSLKSFTLSFINDFIKSISIIIFNEKNFILLIFVTLFFFVNKNTKYKKEYLLISFLIIEPIILFSFSEEILPSLRYFSGLNSAVLILTALTFNELCKNSRRGNYLIIFLLFLNFYFIFENIKINHKIDSVISKNHSFYNFNEDLDVKRSKILYLINLKSQESLNQNLLYLDLYENNLIKKNKISKKFIEDTRQKIKKINYIKDPLIINKDLKKNITYFNYTHLPISNLNKFFEFVRENFDYVAIEESEVFYLDDAYSQKEIKDYVRNNFILKKKQFEDDKIFLRSQSAVIHYFTKSLTAHDYAKNIDNKKFEIIYGLNYSLYELN